MAVAEDVSQCVACGISFRARDAGFLGCRAHPQPLGSDTGHFRCCGMAPRNSACATHAECDRTSPGGCHRMDHCATSEDRRRILSERPFVVGPLDQALSQMPFATKPDGVRVFHVTHDTQLDNRSFYVSVPRTWRGPGVTTDGRLRINLRAEHDTLRAALVEREYEMAHASIAAIEVANDLSDPYASEWVRHTAGVDNVSTPLFVPFVLVMRIESVGKGARGMGCTPCAWTG